MNQEQISALAELRRLVFEIWRWAAERDESGAKAAECEVAVYYPPHSASMEPSLVKLYSYDIDFHGLDGLTVVGGGRNYSWYDGAGGVIVAALADVRKAHARAREDYDAWAAQVLTSGSRLPRGR